MPLLTLPDAPPATAAPQRPAAVRVHGGSAGGERIIPLAIGKTTIGSSPQCIVCLPAADARPLQCLVTTTAERTEATRWGAGALLNGREFTRATINAGDRLVIGRCHLEFLASDSSEAVAPPAPEAAPGPSTARRGDACEHPQQVAPISTGNNFDSAEIEPELELAPEPVAAKSMLLIDTPPIEADILANVTELHRVAADNEAPLAPPATAVALPAELADAPDASPAPTQLDAASSQLFADRLIVDLWQASYLARRRTSTLVEAVRDARRRADAMAADLSALEVEFGLARAAYDSHAVDHEQLHLELIERDRQAAERMAPLQAEIDSLRSQLQESQTELAEQAAHCEDLDAALAIASQRPEPTSPPPEPPLEDRSERVAELEQSLAVQIDQAAWLSRELGELRTEIERARTEINRQTARTQELEGELDAAQAARASLEQSTLALADRDATIESLQAELASNRQQLNELSNQLATAAEAEETRRGAADERQQELENAAPTAPLETEPPAAEESIWPSLQVEAETKPAPARATDFEPSAFDSVQAELPAAPVPQPTSALFAAPVVEPSTPPAEATEEPTSFIDKYRHLLKDDAEGAAPSESQPSRMMLDDEFLSPAKAAQHVSPADDSDDALEAYMAGMMQRMRGVSSTPAHVGAAIVTPMRPVESTPLPSTSSQPLSDESPSDEPFDIESMKQGRRPAASTDLAAMREIANSSARSAIATHRKRRTAESTVGKVIVAVIALATSAGLMWKSSSTSDWEFVVGAVFGVIGLALVVVIGRIAGRAASDKRADTRANAEASDEESTSEV